MSRPKLGWAKIALFGSIFMVPLFAISLPEVTLPGIRTIDAKQYLTPVYGEGATAVVFNVGDYSRWTLTTSVPVDATLKAPDDELVFEGIFPSSSTFLAATISRPLSVNLTQYPILYVQMNVSKGTAYGIRFFSRLADGSVMALWKNEDALNHRTGTGQFEDIQVNMERMVQANTARSVTTLTGVRVYVERGPSMSSASFELQLQKFKFLIYPFRPAEATGYYHAIYLTMNQPQVRSSWNFQSVRVEGQLSASPNTVYIVYLLDGFNIYRTAAFKYDPASQDLSFTVSVLSAKAKAFSETLPIGAFSLVIVASSGTLYHFGPKSVTLNYMASEAQTSSPPGQVGTPNIYVVFLGALILVAVSLLLYDQFRTAKPVQFSFSSATVGRGLA